MSEQWGRPRWDETYASLFDPSKHRPINPPPPQPDRQLISNYEAGGHRPGPCGLANTLYLFTLAIVTGAAIGLLLWKILGR